MYEFKKIIGEIIEKGFAVIEQTDYSLDRRVALSEYSKNTTGNYLYFDTYKDFKIKTTFDK